MYVPKYLLHITVMIGVQCLLLREASTCAWGTVTGCEAVAGLLITLSVTSLLISFASYKMSQENPGVDKRLIEHSVEFITSPYVILHNAAVMGFNVRVVRAVYFYITK